MARTWITDRWVKDATVTLPDGTQTRLAATGAQLRNIKTLPEHFRTARFGHGSRWKVEWLELTGDGAKRRSKVFTSRTHAEEFAAELEDDTRSGRYVDPTLRDRHYRDVAEEWLQSKRKIKDATWVRYRNELDAYILPKWGHRQIGSITRSQVNTWVTELQTGHAPYQFRNTRGKRTPRPLSPATVQHIVRNTFGAVLRYAIEYGIITADPSRRVELPRVTDTLDDLPVLTVHEVETLAETAIEIAGSGAIGDRIPVGDDTLIRLLAYCGARVGEATALKVGDIDYKRRRATIRRTWTIDRESRRTLGTPKTWEKRQIPLPGFLLPELRQLTTGQPDEAFVFRSAWGKAIDQKNWYNRVFRPARVVAGVPHIKIHDLRHTAASMAIRAGADVKVVQQMLGHKDATETLNTYSHLWPDRLDEVMQALENYRSDVL